MRVETSRDSKEIYSWQEAFLSQRTSATCLLSVKDKSAPSTAQIWQNFELNRGSQRRTLEAVHGHDELRDGLESARLILRLLPLSCYCECLDRLIATIFSEWHL